MFRLLVIACFLQFSIGKIILGRVLLDGDATKSVSVPTGTSLTVLFQDISVADKPAIVLNELKVSNLVAFPFSYQMEIPNDLIPSPFYSLNARITNGDDLLFINDQIVSVPVGKDGPITINIPVKSVTQDSNSVNQLGSLDDTKPQSWPEMVGKEGTYVVQYIKEKTGLTDVFTILEGSPITMDYRTDRVRVVVNAKGIVTQVPSIG